MEKEKGTFCFDDVADDIVNKLIIRHPHVFGDLSANNTDEALTNWDNIKLKTKGMKSQGESMVAVPKEFPALMRAQKVQSKAAKTGFDWPNVDGAFQKLDEEINELKTAMSNNDQSQINDEFGDVLFSCVNISRFIKADSEECLTGATEKFIKRFLIVEKLASEQGIDLSNASLDKLNELWDSAKNILTD